MKDATRKKEGGRTRRRRRPHGRVFLWVGIAFTVCLTLVIEHWLRFQWWLAYLLAVNIATLVFYGYDKSSARHGRWRVPEYVLHVLAFAGGTPAAFLGQRLFRHKTVKGSFRLVFWIVVIIQAALVCWAAWEFGRSAG